MTSKHTPGPWAVHSRHRTFIRANDGNKHVANTDSLGDTETNEANARLIAEAPELLRLARELIDYDVLRCLPFSGDYDVSQWEQRARAALARVDGGATK